MNKHLSVMAILVFAMALALSACGQLTEDGRLMFATADPRLSIGFRLLPAPPLPASTPAIVPPTATVVAMPTVTPTPCDPVIKGNIAADGTKIAHSPGQANYDNVVISPDKGEKTFCTLDEAIAAGWRPAQR